MNEILLHLRKSRKFSQDFIASELEISRPTYIAIEKGEKDITLSQLKKISQIFDVPFSLLLGDDFLSVQHSNIWKHNFVKFYALVLKCIEYGSGSDGKIPKTKLAKLIYLCDFAHYYHYLTPISGLEYKRLAHGPVAIEFFEIIENDTSVETQYTNRAILVSLVEKAEEGVLNHQEEEIIKKVCKKWKNKNTSKIVDFTHNQIPWSICREHEVIPYELINNEEPENVY